MLLSVNFPSFIKPEIIPGLPIRWYGLMYIVAFSVAFLLYRRQVRERRFPITEDELSSMFFWCILALIIGARVFSTLVYEPVATNIYLRKPWLIFWPFHNGKFTGFQGMSYHGGVIGGLIGIIIWSKRHRYDIREISDMFAAAIPLGYTAGRLGNFINAELYGRVTSSPLGMIFPIPEWDSAHRFSPKIEWVRDIAEKSGIDLNSASEALINLPRHPSQLYEAFFEGIFIWVIIWLLRKKSPFKGFITGLYVFSYGLIRFFIEYFREPDADLGYRIQLGQNVSIKEISYLHPWGSFSTGQILCMAMIFCAVLWWILASRLPGHKMTYFYEEKKEAQKQRRKRPKKFK
ncbi:MAG: prolipoprotein diacylglyceryl transferase [Spirochaetaceae bacterium]|nr:prolipoprotein diacylglyceryl transferase [Spirochaetaceae bacterium]